MPTTESFSALASTVLPPSGAPWEGHCNVEGRFYSACVVGDRAHNTFSLDFKSGSVQMMVTRRSDGSFLTREGLERGWRVSSTAEVALAETILQSAVEAEGPTRPVELTIAEHGNVVALALHQKRRTVGAAASWVRSTTWRVALVAAFAFVLLALI